MESDYCWLNSVSHDTARSIHLSWSSFWCFLWHYIWYLHSKLPPCNTKTATQIQPSHCPKAESLVIFFPIPFTWGSILHVSSCASIDCHLFSIQEGRERKCCDRSLFFCHKQQVQSIFRWRLNLFEARQPLMSDTQVASCNPLPWQCSCSVTYRHKSNISCVWNMWGCQV